MLLALLLSTLAHASCPTIQLGDESPATIKLEGKQKNCSAASVFRCAQGSLRVSGDVKSISTGSHQITAYCVKMYDTAKPGSVAPPTNAQMDEEVDDLPSRPDFDAEFGAFEKPKSGETSTELHD